MFDWFWEFLYSIAKTLFRLIDGLLLCANKLCGIEPVNFNGEKTDFMSYLLFSDEIGFAFKICAILATILLVIFTVFMIIRSIAKEKVEGSPSQIAIKAFKTLLMFFLIPVIMIAFMALGNAFMKALYAATTQSAATPGTFLFTAFAADGGMNEESVALFRTGELNYYSTSDVATHMDLSEFPFLFAIIAGGVVLFGVGSAMLIFVDRVLSIVILYIVSPISLATSVIDEGARFKLWRDQFLSKFIMGYGMILAINIYALVCGLVMKPGFNFFEDEPFLDLIMKLLIIAGGALTMQKSMALIGNLVSSGAGSNELRDNISAGALAKMAMGGAGSIASKALGVAGAPLSPFKRILGDAYSQQTRHLGARLLRGLGLNGGYGKKTDKDGNPEPGSKEDSESKNNEKANYGSDPNAAKNAINDDGFKRSFNKSNVNNDQAGQNKNGMVNKAINGGDKNSKSQGGTNDSGNTNQQTGGK